MKINFFLALIALLFGVLMAYLLYLTVNPVQQGGMYALTSGVAMSSALIGGSIRVDGQPRLSVNIKVLSGMIFTIFLVIGFVLTYLNISLTTFVVVNALILLIYISALYNISRVKFKNPRGVK